MPVRTSTQTAPKTTTKPTTQSTGPRNKDLANTIDSAKKQLKSLGWLAKSVKKETERVGTEMSKSGTKALDKLEQHGVKFENRRTTDGFDPAPKKR